MIYENPLDKYRSYSVHHILLLGRSTEEAQDFCDEAQNVQTLEAIERCAKLGEAVVYKGKSDKMFLVMDSRRFSQFTIENLRYEVLVNGLMVNQSHANLVTDITMTIVDSVGITFINFLQWLLDVKLRSNTEGTIFLLKTVFVGHNTDGTSETVQTVTIPMHLQTLSVNLDQSKGIYNCEFFGNTNFNIRKQYRWFQIGNASTYFTGQNSNTLGQIIASFEAALNKKSSEYYNKIQESKVATSQKSATGAAFGRQVGYLITIPKSWESMTFTGKAEGASTETNFLRIENNIKSAIVAKETEITKKQEEATKAKKALPGGDRQVLDTNVSVQSGLVITEVLDTIFSQVHEIKEMGNFKQSSEEAGFVTFYKYITAITSDDASVTVHLDVVEFKVPNKLLVKKNKATKDTVSKAETQFYKINSDGVKVPNNYMEYDFIFTGKNKDILSFDLKIESLEFFLASSIKISEGKYFSVSDTGKDSNSTANDKLPEVLTGNKFDPILMPMNTKDADLNFSQYSMPESKEKISSYIASTQEYTRNLSRFYAANPVTTSMTIKGNPNLLRKFNFGTVMKNINVFTNNGPGKGNSIASDNSKQAYRDDLERRVLKNLPEGSSTTAGVITLNNGLDAQTYATAPVFIKINIKGPNVDLQTNELIKGADFAVDALPDIYFAVFKMTHIFEGSAFTQEIELFSQNIYSDNNTKAVIPDAHAVEKR